MRKEKISPRNKRIGAKHNTDCGGLLQEKVISKKLDIESLDFALGLCVKLNI